MAAPACLFHEALGDRYFGLDVDLKVSSSSVLTCQRNAYFNVTEIVEHVWQRRRQNTAIDHPKGVVVLTTQSAAIIANE